MVAKTANIQIRTSSPGLRSSNAMKYCAASIVPDVYRPIRGGYSNLILNWGGYLDKTSTSVQRQIVHVGRSSVNLNTNIRRIRE